VHCDQNVLIFLVQFHKTVDGTSVNCDDFNWCIFAVRLLLSAKRNTFVLLQHYYNLPTWYHQYREQYQHNSKLLQCTVHCLAHYAYCALKNFQQLYIQETNILSDVFILFTVLF